MSAGEMQAEKETVTQHIGMPVITEEDNSGEEGMMIEILTNWKLVLIAFYFAVFLLKQNLIFWTMFCFLAKARLVFNL